MTSLPNIIAMGEVMLELSPQFSPQRAGSGGFELAFAGDTFNTAVYLARQGLKVSYLTELGSDKFSDQIIALAESESVCMNGCIRSDGALPGLYLIENNAEGEREFYYWRRHSAARQLLMTPEKVQRICRAVGKADVFYLSGISMAVMGQDSEQGFWALIDSVQQQQKTLVFDPNFRPRLWPDLNLARDFYQKILGYCDVVFPTLDDDTLLWGLSEPEAIIDFYHSLGVAEVVLKLPAAKAMVSTGHEQVLRSSRYRGAVVDTTGAGDAFNAAYLHARYAGASLAASLDAGHRLAAKVIGVRGAIIWHNAEPTSDSSIVADGIPPEEPFY